MGENYERNIQDAVAGAERVPATADLNVISLRSGVVLKKKNFPILLLNTVVNKFKYPPIPEYWDEERKRGVKNPDHPEYLRQKDEIDNERGLAAIDTLIAFGTELVSVPVGMSRPEDDGWINEIEAIDVLGIVVRRDSPAARYLAWVKYVAITDTAEFDLIMSVVQSAVGVSGEKVATAIDNFRNNP